MAVPQEALERARTMLQGAKRPLFLHDDDCDGTASFVICYQFCGREGKSVPIKRSPSVGIDFLRSVHDYEPDLIVVLDKPRMDAEFLQAVRVPVLWIDHHEPQSAVVKPFQHVFYLNPRIWDDTDNRPTSYWAYQVTGTNLWLATTGCVGDWHIPDFMQECHDKYPELVPAVYSTIGEAYVGTPIGMLIRVIQFNLKGQSSEAKKSILTLTRIEHPLEVLGQTTARGKFLWRKYEKLAAGYDALLAQAREAAGDGKILFFIYEDDAMTFTGELSNELLLLYPKQVILVGRHHESYYKCSLRSTDVEIPSKLTPSLSGLDGYGGGHKHACGLVVHERDWATFKERFSKLVDEEKEGKRVKGAYP